MATRKWDNTFLDEMRNVGDPPADQVVSALFEGGNTYSVWALIETLFQNDQPVPENLPAQIRSYFELPIDLSSVNLASVESGQRLFTRCGPEILMVLACYSLPASYAARKGVQVLYRTGYLNKRPNHRVFETTQMVMDVMGVGGLSADGRGVRTAQKVRVMHAAIRRLLLTDPEKRWDEEFGVPINQEDLAGTFLAFTYVIIDGLRRLGIETSAEEQQAYLETWKVIGRILGIQKRLIPETMTEAKELCELIQKRQLQSCPEGKAMNDSLLQMLEGIMPPGPWRSLPGALMRHFLPPDIADSFGIPEHASAERVRQVAAELKRLRNFALLAIEGLVAIEGGGKRSPFIIPTNLHHEWARSHLPSLWQQLRR